MNPHTNYVAVGLFLLIGTIALVGLIMWLGKAGDTAPRTDYVVQIDGNVNGLSNGSVVRYLGVNVGSVVNILLHTNVTRPIVEVFIEIEEGLPIGEATYATLVVQGVTGIANIDLANDEELARPQAIHPSGVPIIPFRASGLSALLSGGGDIASNASRLLTRLNAWAGEENRLQVEAILENLRLLSDSLAAQSEEVPELVASLRGTLASLERASRGLETAVADDWPAIASDLKATSANLSAASSRVDGWLERHEESVDRFLGEGLNDLSGLVTDLHETSEQLNRLAVRLREDPSRLIYRPQQDPVVVDP
jgi:phospholipid/cholesterol/gamma-HCH transport system substrate-binding protein